MALVRALALLRGRVVRRNELCDTQDQLARWLRTVNSSGHLNGQLELHLGLTCGLRDRRLLLTAGLNELGCHVPLRWCPEPTPIRLATQDCAPCHAEVLLELANAPAGAKGPEHD